MSQGSFIFIHMILSELADRDFLKVSRIFCSLS